MVYDPNKHPRYPKGVKSASPDGPRGGRFRPTGGGLNYDVVRFYFNASIRKRVIKANIPLWQVKIHTHNPETSSSTAKGKVARARTRRVGPWFDGYTTHKK